MYVCMYVCMYVSCNVSRTERIALIVVEILVQTAVNLFDLFIYHVVYENFDISSQWR